MDPATVLAATLVAALTVGYALWGLFTSLRRARASYYQTFREFSEAAGAPGKRRAVEILVTNDAGESVVLPLQPDSEDSIRDFLRRAEATIGG